MINYGDFPADSWNKTVDGSEVRKIIREEVRAEGERIVKSLVKAINLQPAVSAIPIEWINQFVIDTCSSEHDTDFPVFLSWLDKMTEKWRKENADVC